MKAKTKEITKEIKLDIPKEEVIKKFADKFELEFKTDENDEIQNKFGYIINDEFQYNHFCKSGDRIVVVNGKFIEENNKTTIKYNYKKKKENRLPAFIIYNLLFLGVLYITDSYIIGVPILLFVNILLIIFLKQDTLKALDLFHKKLHSIFSK